MRKTIVILHGWGITGEKYKVIKKLFEKAGYVVLSPDMPGFGKERLVKDAMTVDDYVEFVHKFLQQKKLKKVILLGHSFGGRVSAKFASQYPEMVESLILTGAPLIKKPLPLHKQLISMLVKKGKAFVPESFQTIVKKGIYRSLGEWDYYKAGNLKKTFQNVIAEDLSPVLPHIKNPTLLVWGDNDTFVPLKIGQEIAQIVKGAILIRIPNATHKLPYENPSLFTQEVLKFLT